MKRRPALRVALVAAAFVAAGATASTAAAPAAITTVAGTGVAGRTGDGGLATAAEINHPRGIAILRGGGFIFAEPYNNTVRKVAADGTISTVAGTGRPDFSGDGGPATAAGLNFVHGVAVMPDGGFVLADFFNNRIRRVSPDGTITTVVGDGRQRFAGDGGPATQASIALPRGIATLPDGELLIPDSNNQRVRLVRSDGTIVTVAGNGRPASTGDGGPATSASLDLPFSVAPLPGGGFLVAEERGNRIRRVDANGIIETVAGTGVAGYSGDGGPATSAQLANPHSVATVPDGGFLIADAANNRVRRVLPNGTIVTVAGAGAPGYGGDGGPAAAALLNTPKAVAVTRDERGFLVGDALNHRVRLVSIDLRRPLVLRAAASYRARSGRTISVTVTVSRAARLDVTVRRRGRAVARAAKQAVGGRTTLVIRKRLATGAYGVRIAARAADGRIAVRNATLRISR